MLSCGAVDFFMLNTVRETRAAKTGRGYDPVHYARLAAIEDKHFWFTTRRSLIGTFARRITESLPPGYRVLEVGCGTGNVLGALESACDRGSVFGMDCFLEGLSVANRRGRERLLLQADANNPPFRVEFDMIGAFDVIEHLPDDELFLKNMNRMLRPGGYAMITVPASKRLWSEFDELAHHYRRYEKKELETKLGDAGFQEIFVSPFMMAIMPIVWLHRKWRAAGPSGPNDSAGYLQSETRVVPILNGVLRGVLALESAFVKLRIRLPFGTSLIAVARKP